MDYEKLHKDTIAKLQEMVNSGKITVETARGICADFVPESEDERIKRDIIEVLRYGLECEESVLMPGATTTLKEATAWLEKQGNKEYALKSSKDEDVHKFVQYIEKQAKAYEINLPNRSYDIYAFAKDIFSWLEKQCEKRTNGNEREIPNSQQKSKIKYVYTKFREGDVIVEIKPNGDCDPVRVKYVCSSHYSCESDDGKVYLSLPIINQDEYKLIEQNPAWSEEDDQYLLVCKNALAKYQTTDKWDAHIISQWLENKLKSIRPQTPWKPSDEQLHYLSWIANIKLGDSVVEQEVSKHLNELLEDLKKLKG